MNKIIPVLIRHPAIQIYESGVFHDHQLPWAHISAPVCCHPMLVSPAVEDMQLV